MTRRLPLSITAIGGSVAGLASAAGGATPGPAPPPPPPPPRVPTKNDKPRFPLKPGTTLTYQGVKDGKRQRDVFRVTHRTRVIDGIRCRVIDDRVYSGGQLSERTRDYYSQDARGRVWYFGEDTAELDRNGHA